MPERFSPELTDYLHEHGWHTGRQVDVSRFVEVLSPPAIDLHPPAQRILEEFGGLVLPVLVTDPLRPDITDPLHLTFEIADTFQLIEVEALRWLEGEAGVKLCPVASLPLGPGYLPKTIYLSAHDGRVLALDGEWLYYDALESIDEVIKCNFGDAFEIESSQFFDSEME